MADMGPDTSAQKKRTRREVAERLFLDKAGAAHPRASAETVAVRFHFVESGETLDMHLEELAPGVRNAAAAFGLNVSVGNTFGGITDTGEAFEVAETRWKRLLEGEWSAGRETGPRTTDLSDAVIRLWTEAGQPADDARVERLRARIKDDEEFRKGLSGDPKIQVHLAAIRQERAERRAREAAERAGGAPSKALTMLEDL